MNKRPGLSLLSTSITAGVLAAGMVFSASAAKLVVQNTDPAGQGLNDLTPKAPLGSNPGTTVGEQRRLVYQFAADLWGAVLKSNVNVYVEASFQPLSCQASSGVLGSAGTNFVFNNFPNAALADTWYHSALADAIAGEDLALEEEGPEVADIVSRFNSNLGTPGCLETSSWYYGLDGNSPAGSIDFLSVVMHEIGHGLGFQGFNNLTTGTQFNGLPDVYSTNVFDNASGKNWIAMTDAERITAAKADGLVWTGANVTAQVPLVLDQLLQLTASGTATGTFQFGPAAFGPAATAANFSGSLVLVNDGSASPNLGCVASPANAYAGNIALVDRGTCAFEIKTKNAQDAGAIAVVVANNTAGVINMANDSTVEATIPALMVSQADGATLKAGLPGVNVALAAVPGGLAGADAQQRARLYAPAALATGSSFSHYDISAQPNALMEPAINDSLNASLNLDLTPALYADEGWSVDKGPLSLASCKTGVPVSADGGLIVGANVAARAKLCASRGASYTDYTACFRGYVAQLSNSGLLTDREKATLQTCTSTPRTGRQYIEFRKP